MARETLADVREARIAADSRARRAEARATELATQLQLALDRTVALEAAQRRAVKAEAEAAEACEARDQALALVPPPRPIHAFNEPSGRYLVLDSDNKGWLGRHGDGRWPLLLALYQGRSVQVISYYDAAVREGEKGGFDLEGDWDDDL